MSEQTEETQAPRLHQIIDSAATKNNFKENENMLSSKDT